MKALFVIAPLALSGAAMGLLMVGCFASPADYCAAGTPECMPRDAAAPDQAAPDSAPDVPGTEVGPPDMDGPLAADADGDADAGRSDTNACDPSKGPSEDPCVVDEGFGIFVSATGSDANPGTRLMPLATLQQAMVLAKTAGKRVYVCTGTYAEKVVVSSALDGVSLYGGLDCSSWAYSAANTVTVAPTAAGFALQLDGLTMGITVEDLTFVAQNTNPAHAGESSIAAFANGAQNVVLRRVGMVAGTGTDGAAGASAGATADGGTSNWFGTAPSYPELNGRDAADGGPGASVNCRCADSSSSTGGQGGGGGSQMPAAGLPNYGDDAGAGSPGTNSAQCARGGAGLNGLDAPMGSSDAPSAVRGSISSMGWTAAIGTAGSNGKPGQGGGGGGDGVAGTGGGGGGACGGCGGAGGKPGTGGGSSIALLSFNSNVSLADCTLTSRAAGRGGTGGNGEQGQVGSFVGGNGIASGCPGGGGGAGVGGNGAQGGPGGISAGIVFSGNAPIFNGAAVTAMTASLPGVTVSSATAAGGAKGDAGAAASTSFGKPGADGPPSVTGLSQAVVGL